MLFGDFVTGLAVLLAAITDDESVVSVLLGLLCFPLALLVDAPSVSSSSLLLSMKPFLVSLYHTILSDGYPLLLFGT